MKLSGRILKAAREQQQELDAEELFDLDHEGDEEDEEEAAAGEGQAAAGGGKKRMDAQVGRRARRGGGAGDAGDAGHALARPRRLEYRSLPRCGWRTGGIAAALTATATATQRL